MFKSLPPVDELQIVLVVVDVVVFRKVILDDV